MQGDVFQSAPNRGIDALPGGANAAQAFGKAVRFRYCPATVSDIARLQRSHCFGGKALEKDRKSGDRPGPLNDVSLLRGEGDS